MGDAEHVLGHHVADMAAVGVGEVGGLPRRGGEQPQPPRPMTLGAEFVAAQQVALGDDAGEIAGLVHHAQAGDAPGQHQLDGFLHRRVRRDGDDVAGHDVGDDHRGRPSIVGDRIHPDRRRRSAAYDGRNMTRRSSARDGFDAGSMTGRGSLT